ncbi:uncharacterized protein LOC132048812 [Lycium ferocissimum]|uniref:uncharacterized protein LOC132048812 n=1 Tax=Lycium ferocissimum TaxID=112874 RepID=UPI00281678DF|nr:uncharacterized protein LOC132048812 [Lycium ferocissimum]
MASSFMERFCFNVENVPDRFSLEKIRQKSTETYREYASRWRELAAHLVVVGEDIEDGLKTGRIVSVLNRAGTFGAVGGKNKREDIAYISRTTSSKSRGKEITHKNPDNYQSPPPANYIITSPQYSPMSVCYAQPGYQALQPNYQILALSNRARQPNYRIPAPNNQAPQNQTFQNQPPPANYAAPQKKPMRAFTPLLESRTSLFAKLRDTGRMSIVPPKPANPRIDEPTPPNVDTNPLSKHGGNQIHMIERGDEWEESPTIIHPDIEGLESTVASLSLQERKEVLSPPTKKSEASTVAKREPFVLKYPSTVARIHNEPFILKTSGPVENAPFVIKTPHQMMINKEKEIAAMVQGMTRSGRCYAPEEPVLKAPRHENPQKRPITEGEAENFWRQMPVNNYSIIEHLHKTPARISVMSLLLSSSQHRLALMKALDEVQVPAGTTSETLAEIVGYVVRAHRLSFSDDELPKEGKSHNKALHITVKCRDKIIPQVLIDGGAGLNVCPVTTLKQLGYDIGKIRQSQTNVKAYDGATSDPIGEIDLHIQMGPVEFVVEFVIMDIKTSYNLLLGQPWLHAAGVVASSLHQYLKFIWDDQEVVIHGKGSVHNYPDNSVPVIEKSLVGANFHTVKLAMIGRRGDDEDIPMLLAYKIVATTMIRSGFEPGKGLGKNLQGIREPVSIKHGKYRFGVGYKLCEAEEEEAEYGPRDVEEEYENRPTPNLEETEAVNLGNEELVQETRISVHLTEAEKEGYQSLLKEYEDVFAWSYTDMPGLSTNIVAHRLPIFKGFAPVKQKTRQPKLDVSI